jgi:protein-S-isoprenylcysteine O-methyltransferase Ste14
MVKTIENKIPPPILMLVIAAAMWGVAELQTSIRIDPAWRIGLFLALNVTALVFGVGGIIAFRRARTTINPVQIERASRLVTGGIYRLTRNPMYVGLTALLATWAVWLASPWTLLGPVLFALFTHHFQILPEERVMRAKFGQEYEDYRKRVRRWF